MFNFLSYLGISEYKKRNKISARYNKWLILLYYIFSNEFIQNLQVKEKKG